MNLKTNLFALFLFVAITFISVSCEKKDYYDPTYQAKNPLTEISAPEGFAWKTTRSSKISVSVDDRYNGQYNYLVEVFEQNPVVNPNATLISRGYAKKNSPFVATLTVPGTIENVFIRQTTPDGLSSVRMVSVTNADINCNFADVQTRAMRSLTRAVDLGTVVYTAPDENDTSIFPTTVPSGAVNVTNSNYSWLPGGVAGAYKNYIINSSTPSRAIKSGLYTALYVTENATISTLENLEKKKIFILPGKKLTITGRLGASTPDWVISIGKGATLEVKGHFEADHNTKIYNLGTVSTKTFFGLNTSVFYNAGTLQIEGTEKNAMQMSGSTDGALLFYNVGTVNVKGGWTSTNAGTIYNSPTGNITVDKAIDQRSPGNKFINDNTVTCGEFISTGSAGTQNNATMTVLGNTKMDSADTWINNGIWTTQTMETITYAATFLNKCKLVVKGLLTLRQARFVNDAGAYISAQECSLFNTRMEMGSLSFFVVNGTATFAESGTIGTEQEGFYGTGDKRALLKLAKVVAGNTAPNIIHYAGNLQVACNDHPEASMHPSSQPRWTMDTEVEWASASTATVTIPQTACNEGYNGNTTPPADPDPQDVVDPYIYTYLFEDEWPLYGDYDMNDVAIRVNDITKTINAGNNVTKLKFTYKLEAVGASRSSAAALMLDGINASQVQSITYSEKSPGGFNVTSSGVEADQTTAIVPLFSDAHGFLGKSAGEFINTVKGGSNNISNVPSVTIEIAFANPVPSTLDVSSFNLFIVTSANAGNLQSNSRQEIHLRGYEPSKKANTSLFGNNNDNSDVGPYYSSKDNLVWAIVIPSAFRWPVEHMKISNAYGGFANWVKTSGEENKGWWEIPAGENNVY